MKVHFSEFGWTLIIFFLISIYATVVEGQVKEKSEWVKGGVYVGRSASGSCVSKPFVKVGDTENNADDDRQQILGYNPLDIQRNYKGDIVWERVYEDDFAEINHPYKSHPCRCPPYNE